MIKNQFEQYECADFLLKAICKANCISFCELTSTKKTNELNALRGIFCFLSREYGVHPDRAARMLQRTRQNVINQAKKYLHYIQIRDPYTISLLKKIITQYNSLTNEKR
mgnify:CR=1 FL=1